MIYTDEDLTPRARCEGCGVMYAPYAPHHQWCLRCWRDAIAIQYVRAAARLLRDPRG